MERRWHSSRPHFKRVTSSRVYHYQQSPFALPPPPSPSPLPSPPSSLHHYIPTMPGHPDNPICGPAAYPADLDPETATRREFTEKLTAIPPPDYPSLDPKWFNLFTTHRELLRKLAYHEVMKPNIDDPYMKPAVRKTKVHPPASFPFVPFFHFYASQSQCHSTDQTD